MLLRIFKKHNQLMKLMQSLMGLDDSYMQIRSNILSRDPLPDVKGAFAIISSEESHRYVVTGSGGGTSQRSQSSVFNSSVPNRGISKGLLPLVIPSDLTMALGIMIIEGPLVVLCWFVSIVGLMDILWIDALKSLDILLILGKIKEMVIMLTIRVLKTLIKDLLTITILLDLVPLMLFLMNIFQNFFL